MNEADFLRLVRGESRGLLASAGRMALGAASIPYGMVVGLRNASYDRKSAAGVAIPVVSVGNITLGGTGKTPMVEWVARRFRSRGLRVAILSRGYGHEGGLNDEGRVLEENLPDVPHLQGADRLGLARIAVEELESQILVLDDGFQHRRLGRDLDIVLLDALEPFGLGRMFPRGLLREPVKSLRRAGVVVLSRADAVEPSRREAIRAEAEKQAGPLRWVEARHAPLDLISGSGASESLGNLADRKVAAFCGIGNPEGFRSTLAGLGVAPAAFRAFADHHPYSAADVADLGRWLRSEKADLALTTQKDLVKLRDDSLAGVPLRALRIGLEITQGRAVLEDALTSLLPGKDSRDEPTRAGPD